MNFDPENPILKLCGEGIALEGEGKTEAAARMFNRAWEEAQSPLEKYVAAHYVARHQPSLTEKLKWDQAALALAQQVEDPSVKGSFPSLYLNIAKCYEDLNDLTRAQEHYMLAHSFTAYLEDDGYGSLIRSGINGGLKRLADQRSRAAVGN